MGALTCSYLGQRASRQTSRFDFEEPPTKKRRVSAPPKQKRVTSRKEETVVSVEELQNIFSSILAEGGVDYQTSIEKLKQHKIAVGNKHIPLFTETEDPSLIPSNYSCLWLSIDKVWLEMRLYQAPYDSNILSQKVINPGAKEGTLYNYVSLFEWPSGKDTTSLLNIRCGLKGEIVWLRKGSMSGSALKALCFDFLERYPFAKQVYLHDAAAVNEIALRSLLPLTSSDAKTWYGKNGCTPVSCNNWELNVKGRLLSQDSEKYARAIKTIRTITIEDFKDFFVKAKKDTLDSLMDKYFEGQSEGVTIYSLVSKLQKLSKKGDLVEFYNKFLSPALYEIFCGKTPEKRAFVSAIGTLHKTILWERSFDH